VKKTTPNSADQVAFQTWLCPELTPVIQNRDYDRHADALRRLDQALRDSGIEDFAISAALEGFTGKNSKSSQRQKRAKFAIYALRAEILRHFLGVPSFKDYSKSLSASNLYAWFCGCLQVDGVRWTSKSTLHRAATFYTAEQLRHFNDLLVEVLSHEHYCGELGWSQPEDLSVCLIDSTCLEANIHYPVDWVLLRDVSRTLLKAIERIRKEGIICRMPESPKALARLMNKECIAMTHTARKADSKRQRKAHFRRMKRLLKRIGEHARRHLEALLARSDETQLGPGHVKQIAAGVETQLSLVPEVIKQAHERIIGGRLVKNEAKILSVYEREIDVIVRNKAGAKVEFGNELFLAESAGGLITDYCLYGRGAPSESKKLEESLARQSKRLSFEVLESVVADRGFDSKRSARNLAKNTITSRICPKSPQALEESLRDESFCAAQTRRASTEAKIAIVKNHGDGRAWRAKGFKHRQIAVGWSILACNLSWTIRKMQANAKDPPGAVAEAA
jgi:hypothetical protein